MPLGPMIRHALGSFEKPISEAYRGIFIDLDAFVTQIRCWAPASNILEVGCGEGAVIERLANAYPNADITGIDITPRVGRLFQGDKRRVKFQHKTIQEFAPSNLASFDLIIMCDILHHIPWQFHQEILREAGKVLKPDGYLVLKDWERSFSAFHLLCHFSDRFLTGDHVKYKSAAELHGLIEDVFGSGAIQMELRIPPRNNNIAYLVGI